MRFLAKHSRELEGKESIIYCEVCGQEIEGEIFYMDDGSTITCETCYDEARDNVC